jgi:MFS transporter, putative metabolite:H+ symporter
MRRASQRAAEITGIAFAHPLAFWVGATAITFGVLAHLPDFIGSAGMGYRMAGMEMSGLMHAGMVLILSGLGLAAYGIIPSHRSIPEQASEVEGIHFRALDDARLTGQHWGLLFVLGIALIIDVMKPATLGFVVPGMKAEYGYSTAQIAVLPFAALTGTTVGSLLWGMLADRVGRRAAILLASILFIATSICGFMPAFEWNLFMCFMMGISAGGMLPIVYALMAESVPARRRGWLIVLHGGMGTVGGYLAASGMAALLEPLYSWRILWFVGLPTGLLMLVLNRWIPESPRFLIANGRHEEAAAIMRRYGVQITRQPRGAPAPERISAAGPPSADPGSRFLQLFRPPFLRHTLTVGMYGLTWGLVNWGFITFIPAILQDRGMEVGAASRLLFLSALVAVPGTILVAYLYGLWSSRKTMALFAALTAGALVAFALVDPGVGRGPSWIISPLMVLLLVGSGGVIAMLSPYTAEVYPTQLRGTGSGFAAGSSKIGGILAPPVAAAVLVAAPGFTAIGFVLAAPIAAAALLVAVAGVETRDRGLEELTGAPLRKPTSELAGGVSELR